jgi:hypothetical protein
MDTWAGIASYPPVIGVCIQTLTVRWASIHSNRRHAANLLLAPTGGSGEMGGGMGALNLSLVSSGHALENSFGVRYASLL